MASADASRTLSVYLPLSLETKPVDGQIKEAGLKDIAKELKRDLRFLERHICKHKDLTFVSIIDVAFWDGLVYLTLSISDEAQLDGLFKCIQTGDNELSKWISAYFMENSMEITAGLKLRTKITCQVKMSKVLYHKCSMQLCVIEEDLRDKKAASAGQSAGSSKKETDIGSVPSTGSVKQKIQEIDQNNDPSHTKALGRYTSAPSASSDATGHTLTAGPWTREDSLLTPSTTREPGGYPYETAKNSDADKLPTVRKSFLLYYPVIKNWKVNMIYIQSECKCLNAEMKRHGVNIYEYSGDIPADQLNSSYQYECHLKSDSFLNLKGNLMGTPPVKSVKFRLEDYPIKRDSWITQGWKISDPHTFDENCLHAHLADLLYHCPTRFSIYDACRQIENLSHPRLHRTNAIQLFRNLARSFSSKSEVTALLFVVTLGSVLADTTIIIKESLVDQTTAQNIMIALRNFRIEELPTTCRNTIYSVCFSLCTIVFGDSVKLMQYLNMCYPFYDDIFLLKKLQSYVLRGYKITEDDTSTYNCAHELCSNLYYKSKEESSKSAEEALDVLLRHMPFNMTLFVTSKMQACPKTTHEPDLQNILHSIVNIRIETCLRDIKKTRNIEKLKNLWKDLLNTDNSNKTLKLKFEAALMSILESYPSSAGMDLAATVVDFVLQFNFFQEENCKKRILDIITDSQNQDVLELFVILAERTEMTSQYLSLTSERFEKFCLRYVIGKASTTFKRNKELNKVLERICKIWNLQLVRQNTQLNNVLVQIWQTELDKYHLKEIMDQLTSIDKMSETNNNIADVFIEHIKGMLKEQAVRVEDVMNYLPHYGGKSVIATRLTANLVCALLDTFGLLYETSSDFEKFLELVSNYKFWISVLHSTGSFQPQVQGHNIFLEAGACISNMVKLFEEHEVHVGFVLKLEKERHTVLSKQLLELKCSRLRIDQYWSEALMKFKEIKQRLLNVHDVMTQVKQQSPELPDGFDAVLERILECRKRLTSGILKANECEKGKFIWRNIERLPDICQYLKDVVGSSVFWNVSFDHVNREYLLKSEEALIDEPLSSLCHLFQEMTVTERTCENSESSCMLFMEILQRLGPTKYGEKWKELINIDELRMEEVLKMFGSSPDISKEVNVAKAYLHIAIDSEIEDCLQRVFSSDTVENTVNAMQSVVCAFGLNWKEDETFATSITSFQQLLVGAAEEYTFSEVKQALNTVFSVVRNLSEDTVNIMITLGKATTLIDFLRTIVDEDIKNLIDAVEDISEQQVRESTVSALIEVKQYLHPLLLQSEKNCLELLQALEKQTKSSRANSASLPQKIEDCIQNLHNLKSLYNGVANRGEQTKEMIKNIIQKGFYLFHLNRGHSGTTFEASYKQNKTKETRKRSTLIDLRSRALLLMNTERKSMNEARFNRDELLKFVENIDLCLDIAEILFALHSSGHTGYVEIKEAVKPDELLQKKQEFSSSLKSWLHDINDERDLHYLMNFIQGNQIHILYRYLEESHGDIHVVQTILKFIHPEMQAFHLQETYHKEKAMCESWSNRQMLHCMGSALHISFEGLVMFQRRCEFQKVKSLSSIVQPNRLTVAKLDEGSPQTVRTVLALYMYTTQRLPEPNHIVFCTRETTWTELELLIRRCLGANEFYKTKVLFCIANVEMLPNEIQFTLVETLRHLHKESRYFLAVICRGSRNHPFIDELSDCVTSVNPVTDKTVQDVFKEHCENVVTVTSNLSGLGKTSHITSMAHKRQKGVVTLHVSGSVRKSHLVDRINMLSVKRVHVLHIDLGSVDNPSELDTFLFELVVLRYVTAGNISVSLQTPDVNIEIANTINDTLRNALQTAVLFQRINLEWNGIEDMIISREVDSPVQVVCLYLKCLENGSLDRKDLCLDGVPQKPLPAKQCKALLCKYLGGKLDGSFPILFTFINVLADQLKKMSQSSFFRVSRLIDMIGNKVEVTVKSKLVEAMIEVSSDFATRSVEVCRESQISTVATDDQYQPDLAASVTSRVDSMIRWEDSNHLMFVFHNQNIHTISALYRKLSKVPAEIRNLFESQMKKKMEDFSCMDQEKLQTILQKVARVNPLPLQELSLNQLSKEYALTADNLLKMVLIMLRIKANIPVVIMGETGCGKTSLIRYLAGICEVEFDVMNIHAGVKEEDILDRVKKNNKKALFEMSKDRWLFLDELNTSDSIGLISDIICHHRCLGKELSPNLTIMGACNPYKLRTTKAISTAGLEGKAKSDELSRLVYRVLPLPEMMVDYVWDFGSLNEKDEETYIHRMIADVFKGNEKHHDLFTCLLTVSQSFVRGKEESSYSVSLRDVQRCKLLTKWFLSILPKKKLNADARSKSCATDIKAMILSLAHCYQSRFSDKFLRKEYRCVIGDTFKLHGYQFPDEQEQYIQTVIKDEQSDILRRMILPPGTARNTALQENVFVILVCIFNRIPIFVVGKPGCSKSLAMQLIKSNLRGKDSEDKFFKELPQLYCVSFQGSESSTSDGIIKVFTKAEKYQESNNIEEVMSVVILDEIGLAEVSRFNPLKVLHNLLEPDGQCQPNVAVVGISNWALDASKMNRAIHLSRTDMDEDELFDTASSISESFLGNEKKQTLFHSFVDEQDSFSLNDIQGELKGMATAYYQYISQLRFKNFHGLRDYYSLIKFVARTFAKGGHGCSEEHKAEMIADGIARNFGGLPDEMQTLYDVFQRHIPNVSSKDKPLMKLVTENIKDPIARHLMLITTGESVLGIIEQKLKEIGCDRKEVIFGSQFEEDLTDDYNYRILSRIILCMEEGMVLILKDLESVYGSLYDMLNQNYTIIGRKKNCRVALGPYSNPICHVADSFRCIVLTDEKKLDLTDPPFLNRFEKQYLRFFDIIEEKHYNVIQKLENWIEGLSETSDGCIQKEEMFPIYNKDLTASLVLKAEANNASSWQESETDESILTECKHKLLWIIKPEVVVRQKMSKDSSVQSVSDEVIGQYFSLPLHNGLENLILQQVNSFMSEESCNGILTVLFTNSNVHTKIVMTSNRFQIQVEKLGAFKSEKQLSSRIQHFWDIENIDILIVQCSAKDDEKHILLTKLVIERLRNKYISQGAYEPKHVYLIIHLDRSKAASHSVSQLNFLSDWKLVMMDSLDCPAIPLPTLCRMTLQEAIFAKTPLNEYIQEELFWAFSRIRYGNYGRDVDSISAAISEIEKSPELMELLENEIVSCVRRQYSGRYDKYWQLEVARDITALTSSASFIDALENFVMSKIKAPLAKLIYKIEENGILESFLHNESRNGANGNTVCRSKRMVWISVAHDERVFSIDGVPDETGPECYTCETVDYALRMPFSKFVYDSIEATKEDFMETVRTYRLQCFLNEDEELPSEVYDEILLQQENFILKKIPDLNDFTYETWEDDYLNDFCTISAQTVFVSTVRKDQTEFTKLILERLGVMAHEDPFAYVIRLHTSLWVHFETVRAQMILIDRCISVLPESKNEILKVLSGLNREAHLKGLHIDDNLDEHSETESYFEDKASIELDGKMSETFCRTQLSENIRVHNPDIVNSSLTIADTICHQDETIVAKKIQTVDKSRDYDHPSAVDEFTETDANKCHTMSSPEDDDKIRKETILVELENSFANYTNNAIDLNKEEAAESDEMVLSPLNQFTENEGLQTQKYEFDDTEPVTTDLLKTTFDNGNNDSGDEKRLQKTSTENSNQFTLLGYTDEQERNAYQADDSLKHISIPDEHKREKKDCCKPVSRFDYDLNDVIDPVSVNENEISLLVSGEDVCRPKEKQIDVVSTVENMGEDSDSISYRLVYTVCKAMFPTTECLKQHRGLKHWLEEVSSTVSLAAHVSRSPTLLYSLRVCTELATELIIPLHLDENLLECIGNTMMNGSALDTEQVFCSIENLIRAALSSSVSTSGHANVNEICQRAMSSYFLRCISADPETAAYKFLYKLVLESNIPEDCMILFKVPISTFLQTVEVDLFVDIMLGDLLDECESNSISSEDHDTDSISDGNGLQLLQSLNTCLKNILENERLDDPFLVLIADTLQDIFTENLFPSSLRPNESCNTQETELGISQQSVEVLYVCHKTIKKHEPGLKYIASVAFCNSFVNQATSFLQSADSEVSSRIINILDVVFSDLPGKETHFLTILFLKDLLSTRTLRQLQRFCIANEDKYNFVRCLGLKNRALKTHFEKSPLCMHVTERVHEVSCFQCKEIEINEYRDKIQSMVKHSRSGRCEMVQFFSFVLRDFYLQLSESNLDDTRRTQAGLILNEVFASDASPKVRIFTKCILGEENFRTNGFLLTDASSMDYVCKASLLTCFYALLLAHYEFHSDKDDKIPVFIQYLVFPQRIKSCFLPGFLNSSAVNSGNEMDTEKSGFGVCLGLCRCGYRISKKDNCSKFICNFCGKIVKTEVASPEDEPTETEIQENKLNVESHQISKHLNPVTGHILQFLVKGSLLGSLSLGFTSEKELESLLKITESEAEQCLSNGIDRHWETLKELLIMNGNDLSALMHVVLSEASNDLFCSTCRFETKKEALDWEKTFDEMVCSVLESRFSHIRKLHQHLNRIHNEDQTSIEQCLLEIDDISSMTTENKLLYFPIVHRIRAKSKKSNFLFELYAHRQEFPLLAKILENEEDLQLPKHILSLVQWHTATVANASYMLKSHDCSTMTAQDFIYFKQDSMKKNVMKARFEAFRKSWDKLKVMLRKYDIAAMMGRIHSESKLGDCLILNEESVPFKVLQTLVGIQNRFLDQVLLIADKCNALKMLERDRTYIIPSVNVTSLKKEDLIFYDIDWDSLLEQESHCNLEYGSGQQIHYDWHSIEEAVARELVSGKSYIVSKSVPEIVFIDELHKNYASLIKELRISTAQQLLSAEISNGIKGRKDEDPRMSTELLTHLGIVMTLLKKTGGDPDQSLVDFVDKWRLILCRHFPKKLLPSPESCVKLCHVVALSELLEELNADSVKEGLGDEYRDKLDGPVYDQLIEQLKDETLSSALFKALKRFTYRCLASRTADPKQSLRLYLSDESFWPVDSFQHDTLVLSGNRIYLSDILPDGLMVRHIFDCFELMETEIERRRQGNLKLSGFATSFQAKSKTKQTSKLTQKKKKISTIRKF